MVRPKVYPDELRERAVRLLHEWRQARGVTDGGYTAIAEQLGLQRETLRRWVLEAEGMDPYRPGVPKVLTAKGEKERIAELERENRELRRANEILKTAAAFFGAELDRRPKK
jgi:transposase